MFDNLHMKANFKSQDFETESALSVLDLTLADKNLNMLTCAVKF